MEKVLPTFDSIEKEAEAVRKTTWERLNASAHPDADPSGAAEKAEHAGLRRHYALVNGRQGLLNLFTVALHHSVEQHQITILRDALNSSGAPLTWGTLKPVEFQHRLKGSGIMITGFRSWPDMDELRLVANVAKHAEGKSAEELQLRRPDLFIPACLRDEPFFSRQRRSLFRPMSGEDLYIGLQDLDRYLNAAEMFWCEFEEALQSKALYSGVS